MKGGKRLTEAKRFRLRQLLFVIAREPDGKEKNIAISESLSIIEPDDEPECCTCERRKGVKAGITEWICLDCGKAIKNMLFIPCGKPVKGE